MWTMQAVRGDDHIQEGFRRQGAAYRRARQLYAAGYEITAIQYTIDEPPEVIAVYRFDGIRFIRIPRLA